MNLSGKGSVEGSRHHLDRTLTKVSFDLRRLFCNRKRSPKRWKSPRQLSLSLITLKRASIHISSNSPFAIEASEEDETENKSGVELQNTAMVKRF